MIEMPEDPVAPDDLKSAFGCFPSGVTAVCAMVDGQPVGMAASSFTSVSLDPPLVSVCVQNSSRTWRQLRSRIRLGVSVLACTQDVECRMLAAPDGDRFRDVPWERTAGGAVFVEGAAAWLDCGIHTVVPAGDHAIALLRVHGLWSDVQLDPLVFHGSRFRTLATA